MGYVAIMNLERAALEQDRRLHGALYGYLNLIGRRFSQEENQEALAEADKLSPGFSAHIVETNYCRDDLMAGRVKHSDGGYAKLQGDQGLQSFYLYYFDSGWPIKYDHFLREEDVVPTAGVWHLNGGEAWRLALEKLRQDPKHGIETMDDLGGAVYDLYGPAMVAIGFHQPRLTKPLLRFLFPTDPLKPAERLNMRTGKWELDT